MQQRTFLAYVAKTDCELTVVLGDKMRSLLATEPEIGDVVVAALAGRRRLLLEWGEGGMTIVGDHDDPAAKQLLAFARRHPRPSLS